MPAHFRPSSSITKRGQQTQSLNSLTLLRHTLDEIASSVLGTGRASLLTPDRYTLNIDFLEAKLFLDERVGIESTSV